MTENFKQNNFLFFLCSKVTWKDHLFKTEHHTREGIFFLMVTLKSRADKMGLESPLPPQQLCLVFIGFSLLSLAETYGFSKCTQYELDIHHVFCIRKKITNLTEAIADIPGYTTHLNLTQNQIQTLPPYAFTNLSALVDLRLEWNSIWKIEKRAFWGLENLTLLNLVENNIHSVNDSFEAVSYTHLTLPTTT